MNRAVIAVVLVLGLVPAGAHASTEDRAVALHAVADHLDGRLRAPNEQTIVYADPDGTADVRMPPQTQPAVERRPGSTSNVVDVFTVQHVGKEDVADGNLAAGTVSATSETDSVAITVAGTTIAANTVRAVARADCDAPGTPEQASVGSYITGLTIDGEAVPVGEPNQVSRVLLVGDTRITVDALRVDPAAEGAGWTTVGLVIRAETVAPLPTPFRPAPINNELRVGTAKTELTCAE